uniref:Uncharacterized protein n=1 Tax=Chrysotila carterae TaxID=13221 RepID=A0A7S4B0T9_CHRCT
MAGPSPNLDVRLTRSQSGNILDIDFIGGLAAEGAAAAQQAAAGAPVSALTARAKVAAAMKAKAAAPVAATAGRRLKIAEHRVHKVEVRQKDSGEDEEELVVSNLRPFTLKVAVHDSKGSPLPDCSLPLRAALLYENGLPVKQTSSSEPLLVGETDVVALQGAATFKLRITSLSSHRDKQRFRIQVTPQDEEVARAEPQLTVVTNPMKSVTKLGRASVAGNGSAPQLSQIAPSAEPNGAEPLKRKYRDLLEQQSAQIAALQNAQQTILRELQGVTALAQTALRANGLKQ